MKFAQVKEIDVDVARMWSSPKPGSNTQILQGSMTVFRFSVLENNAPADMSNVGKVVVNFRKPDKTVISRDVPFSGNVVTYVLGTEEIQQAGAGLVNVKFYSKDESDYILSFPVRVTITATVGDGKILDDIEGPDNPGGTPQEPTIDGIGFNGKWFEEQSGGTTLYSTHYPGSSIVATVTGTSTVAVNFRYSESTWEEPPVIAVRINGGPWDRYQVNGSVLLATGLSTDYTFTFEIVFDGWNQLDNLWGEQLKLTFESLTIDSGATVKHNSDRKNVLFVGDSITAGTRTLGNGDASWQSSSVNTFARLLADSMGANLYTSAFPGTKVIDTFTRDNVKLVSNGKPVPDYDIHTIIVEMGTNDYQKDSNEFISNYQALIDSLRTVYPTQRIYIVGLFENQTAIRRNAELNTLARTNENVTHLSTESLTGVTYTDGLHPDRAGSERIRDFLLPLLEADDWENGGGTGVEPEDPVPDGNLWSKAGNPTSYNPLPAGFGSQIVLPGTYAGTRLRLTLKAKSAAGNSLAVYTEYQNDLNKSENTKKLTPTLTEYTWEFNVTYAQDGNALFIIRDNHETGTDIIIQDVVLTKV